jgi:hypothetical protein
MNDKISLKEVMRTTGLTAYRVHQAREAGYIKGQRVIHKTGKGWEFNKEEVLLWVQEHGLIQPKKGTPQATTNQTPILNYGISEDLTRKMLELERDLTLAQERNLAKDSIIKDKDRVIQILQKELETYSTLLNGMAGQESSGLFSKIKQIFLQNE